MTATHTSTAPLERQGATTGRVSRTRLAGALRRRWPTGLGIAATTAAALVLALLPEELAFYLSAWCVLLAAVIYLTWGVHRGEMSRPGVLRAQTTGVLAFGAVALAATAVDRDLGVYVLAAGWLGHAAWDVVHHRMNAVVPRWYAETCLASDVLVAASLLASTAL